MTGTEDLIVRLGTFSYAGIWLTALLANIVIPVPEEIILLALGYLAGTGKANILILVPVVLSGLFVSDFLMFTLSKRGNRLITTFYNKFFARKIEKRGSAWLEINIEKIIFFSRFMVQLRFIGPFLAGQKKVSSKTFIIYDLLALLVYVPLFLLLGSYFHRKVAAIVADVGVVRNIILILAGILLLFLLIKFVYRLIFRVKEK